MDLCRSVSHGVCLDVSGIKIDHPIDHPMPGHDTYSWRVDAGKKTALTRIVY